MRGKTNSLCFRLTVMTGAILLLCSIALTLAAAHNAGAQFTAVATTMGSVSVGRVSSAADEDTVDYVLMPASGAADAEEEWNVSLWSDGEPAGLATSTVMLARRRFNLAGAAALLVISVLGTAAVYFATRHALRPIAELNEQISAITEHNLDERVSGDGRTDEVGTLCRSFNVMLERLSASFAAQRRFSANVAHELKTPLATMRAGVQVMRLEPFPTPEELGEMLDTVERNTDRLGAIIEDLLRLCSGEEGFETEEVALSGLFSSIFAELGPKIEEKRIETALDCDALPAVTGNPGLLYRAFFNLIENAVKYNREEGSIAVSAFVRNNLGVIRVGDTGIGIPQEELTLIFEPFYRVNKSRSRKTGGAGLGLAVAKTIVERHGWSICAESGPGEGTTFEIRLYPG